MPPNQRQSIIAALKEMAVLLELDGANSFRTGAFSRAARSLEDFDGDIAQAHAAGKLTEIEGVGKGIAEKIAEFLSTGAIAELGELRDRIPPGLVEMTEIPGFGPKKAKAVYEQLAIGTVAQLEAACKDGRIEALKGFGAKTAANILAGIEQRRKHSGRFRLDQADEAAAPILAALRALPTVLRAESAGSMRRRLETVKDLDFVVATEDAAAVMAAFTKLPGVQRVTGQGETKASVVLDTGMAADLRCVAPAQFPFALHHFTGSKEHNTAMRRRAKERGLTMNEYGLFAEGREESLPAEDEAAVFAHLGLAFIAPELRENMGEIEAAAAGTLPRLMEYADIRGILHMHTKYSDGLPTLEDYANWAKQHRIEWMGIADHSQTAGYAGGLKPDRVAAQHEEIDEVNASHGPNGPVLLKGIESDILPDGRLDYEEETLASFDFIVGSIHAAFHLSEAEQTARMLRAVANPYLNVVGHMTGRLLLRRDGVPMDQREVIRACAREGVAIEINGNPFRLELDWRLVHYALEQGCWISLGPDAHAIGGLAHTEYALAMGRKGWLTKDRCVNALSREEFLAWVRRRRPQR